MTFAWSNLSKSTLRELARGVGLPVTKAEAELTKKYGAIPGEELIKDLWTVLRDGWITREPVARAEIVEGLRAARLGDLSIKVGTRTGQISYLRTCRMSATLKSVALAALLRVGSLPFDTPASMVGVPEDELSLPIVEWLRRACTTLTAESLSFVEIGVCLGIGRELRGVSVPVAEEERRDLTEAIVRAAVLAAHANAGETTTLSGDPPAHWSWVLAGAERAARDRTVRAQVVDRFASEVDAILSGGAANAFNAAMTCTSMFFTVLAFGPQGNPTAEQSVQLVSELSYLTDILEPSGTDAPIELRAGLGDPASTDHPSAEQEGTLADFITANLSDVVGIKGPMGNSSATAWLMPAGSALVQVLTIDREDEPTLLRYYASLLNGVAPTAELLTALNMINAQEECIKVYSVEDRVVIEYDQLVDHLTAARLRSTLGMFLSMADNFDNVLQDRFGGRTQSAPVKARLDV